jgi:hypothetical protein
MAKLGDSKDHGTYTREYFDDRWDHITNNETGETAWRDKDEHQTYESDNSFMNSIAGGFTGEATDSYNDGDDEWDDN